MKRPSATLAIALLAAAASADPQLTSLGTGAGGSTSRTCERVLGQLVSGCTNAMFATGACSAACVVGLRSMESSLQRACVGVESGPAFLRAALAGTLVETTCQQVDGGEENEGDDGEDGDEERPTTTLARETGARETPTATASSTSAGTQPTGRTEERGDGDSDGEGMDEGTDEGKPNGVGGSPFDITAGGEAIRPAGWMAAAAAGMLLLVR